MTDQVQITLTPAKRIRIRAGGQQIVDTANGYRVDETRLDGRFYVPRSEVHAEISDGTGGARCPWKGLWKHVDLTIGGQRIVNAAWTYYDTTLVCEPIRDFIAFYASKVDAIDVELER